MKKPFALLCAAALVAAAFFACAGNPPPAADPNTTYELVVLHTNDHHGTTLVRADGQGGLAERATFVKGVREQYRHVLVLDAGDINTGSALSNMFHAEPDIRAYNEIGYDAVTFGNHEFDPDLETLFQEMGLSRFQWLGANVKIGSKYLGKPYIVKDFVDAKGQGFRVGIAGLTTRRTYVTSSPDKSVVFADEIKTAQSVVNTLRGKEKCDIVIILGHLGDVLETDDQNTSRKLAESVPGIDLIIDGHSHSKFEEPLVINGTPIVTANEWGKFMGYGLMEIKAGRVENFVWAPEAITAAAYPPDPEITALLQPYVEKSNATLKEVVMKTAEKFEFGNRLPRYRETATGDLSADATAWYIREKLGLTVDFAFQNGGNIRTELPAGDVTREVILTMLPFENFNYLCTLKGSDVKDLFTFIETQKQGAGGFPQFSKEVRYTLTIDKDKNGAISDLTIGGVPIDPNKLYKVATNDYIANGGDGYEVMKRSVDTFNTSMLLSDIVVDYAKTLPQPVQPTLDGRLKVQGPGAVEP
jgi:5'-nucleotidase/UDP-sugar diphosphatase